jgi:hypothetical protein
MSFSTQHDTCPQAMIKRIEEENEEVDGDAPEDA